MNTERIRSFIAIEIPDETKRRLVSLTASFRAAGVRASWVREPALHLSMRFLGDISKSEQREIECGLTEAGERTIPFDLRAAGVGVFPNRRAPRVIWAGVDGDIETLQTLAAAIEQVARNAGLDPIRNRFRPHVTLGRIRNPRAAGVIAPLLVEHVDFEGGAIPVGRVSLFASELHPEGAKHTVLRSFELGTHG